MPIPPSDQVVKVIGAGLASLEAIPHFVRELVEAEEPILPPLALDHDVDAVSRFMEAMADKEMRSILEEAGYLSEAGYNFNPDNCVVRITGWEHLKPGIQERNRVSYDLDNLDDEDRVRMFDRPAALAT